MSNNHNLYYDNLSNEQKLRFSIHRDTKAICTEACHFMGLEINGSVTNVISELIYKKLHVYGSDLEAFAKHAKRNTINAEDVKLLARRNNSLKEHLTKVGASLPVVAKDKTKRKSAATAKKQEPQTSKEPIITEVSDSNDFDGPVLMDVMDLTDE